jgi:hypothetical protein
MKAPSRKETPMTVVVVNEIPQGDQTVYDEVSVRVLPEGQLPEGCQVHIAGPSNFGWRVITVWDSVEQFEQFRSEKLIPALREVAGDDLVAPTIQPDPVHKLITA